MPAPAIARGDADRTRVEAAVERLELAQRGDRVRDRRTCDGGRRMKKPDEIGVARARAQFRDDARREMLDVRKAQEPRLGVEPQRRRAACERLAHALDDELMLAPVLRARQERLAEKPVGDAVDAARPRARHGLAAGRASAARHEPFGRDAEERAARARLDEIAESTRLAGGKPREHGDRIERTACDVAPRARKHDLAERPRTDALEPALHGVRPLGLASAIRLAHERRLDHAGVAGRGERLEIGEKLRAVAVRRHVHGEGRRLLLAAKFDRGKHAAEARVWNPRGVARAPGVERKRHEPRRRARVARSRGDLRQPPLRAELGRRCDAHRRELEARAPVAEVAPRAGGSAAQPRKEVGSLDRKLDPREGSGLHGAELAHPVREFAHLPGQRARSVVVRCGTSDRARRH
jgi:hypothetical protein